SGGTKTGATNGGRRGDKEKKERAPRRKELAAMNNLGHDAQGVLRRLEGMYASCSHKRRPEIQATSLLEDVSMVMADTDKQQRASSFVGQFMQRQRTITVVSHLGEPLSPRGDRVGCVGRSAYQESRKVPLDILLSSVDDIVSQIYVNFDESMTQVILNALDRVTACDTQNQRDAMRVRVIDELLETLGDEHYDLLQCVMHRPRDIFLRLLEEFCTLEDDDDNTGAGSTSAASPQHALTVRFVKTAKQRSAMREVVFAHNGEATDQRWLAHMTQRYRQLMRESDLDQLFKRDLSVIGSSMPSGAT
ncbi:ATP-dependent RNA helicase, partial [Trypanosoma cruzi]